MAAAQLTMDLLGSLSVVETVVEFAFVLCSLDKFTPFERLFFLMAGLSEMAGEVVLLVIMILWLHEKNTGRVSKALLPMWRFCSKNNTTVNHGEVLQREPVYRAKAQQHLERLSKDPIHVLRDMSTTYFTDKNVDWADDVTPVEGLQQTGSNGDDISIINDKAGGENEGEETKDERGRKDYCIGSGAFTETNSERSAAEARVKAQAVSQLRGMGLVVISLVITFCPTLVLGIILSVGRSARGFRSAGDEGVMTAVTVMSFIALGVAITLGCYLLQNVKGIAQGLKPFEREGRVRIPGQDSLKRVMVITVVVSALIYSIEKVFEVGLLLSRSERLAPDTLSQALIVFQLLELLSVANIIYISALDHFFREDPSPKEDPSEEIKSQLKILTQRLGEGLDVEMAVDRRVGRGENVVQQHEFYHLRPRVSFARRCNHREQGDWGEGGDSRPQPDVHGEL